MTHKISCDRANPMKLAVANNHREYGACEPFMSKKVLANPDRIVTAKAVRECLSGCKIAVTRYSVCSNIVTIDGGDLLWDYRCTC